MATGDTENRVYIFRIQTLIVDGGLLVLRNILDQNLHIQNISLITFLHQEQPTITRLKRQKTITQAQYDLLYPALGGKSPSTADFDITLIICLLRNLKTCGLNQKYNWKVTPQATDTSTEADIFRLKQFRNEVAHISTTTEIDLKAFNSKWTEIEMVLHRLNAHVQNPVQDLQKHIDEYKTSPLDQEAEKRIDAEIDKWRIFEKGLETKLQRVQEDLQNVNNTVDSLQAKVAQLENEKKIQELDPGLQAEKDFEERKKQLKDDLATFYTERYSTIPLSPLFEEHDTPLVDFYIMPEMNSIEMKRTMSRVEETKTPVTSLSDIFKSTGSCETYLTANAGFGKTAFSKYLAVTWCQAHRPDMIYKKYFSEDAMNTMRDFEFLFLVLLRDSSDDCSIDDLIVSQIVQNLSRSSTITIDSLQEILHRERHLVILDGLDEWTHPQKKCARVPKTIPHRNARDNCVILTTTRPWKLGVLNLKTSEIDKKVELVKLSSKSAQTLEERSISKIKDIDVATAENMAKLLNEKIKENKLEDLESVPLLLMYLICLWCDDIPFGQSKCGLYACIVELLLSRTLSKYSGMERTCEPSQSEIPRCFSVTKHEYCIKYYTFLAALGQLAFETLFSENKEYTLVFKQSIAKKYLTPDYWKLGLLSGILSQSKVQEKLTKQSSKVSFSHKTMQEYFCALYISCQNKSYIQKFVLQKCNSLQNIFDMSTVFVFTSGINAEIVSSVSRDLMSVISEDEITSKYRSTTDRNSEPLKDIQDMYMSCIKENPENKSLKLCCQDFFIGKDCEHKNYYTDLKRLLVQNKNIIESINIAQGDLSLREMIDSCALDKPLNINKIFYHGEGEDAEVIQLLNRSVKCVTVTFTSSGLFNKMSKILQNNTLLQAIYIFNFSMSHDVLNDFLNYIRNRKTMTEIIFGNLSCTEHGRSCTFNFDFFHHSELKKLVLNGIPELSQLKLNSQLKHLDMSGICVGEMSFHPEMINIEVVNLYSVKMSASALRDLVKVVEQLSHKVRIKMYSCKLSPETEFEDLKQYIHSSQNFRVTGGGRLLLVFETKVDS